MRAFCLLPIFISFFLTSELNAQSNFSDMLTCMTESPHWEDFYCMGSDGEFLLEGILTQNIIPVYTKLYYHGRPLHMRVSAPKTQRHMIAIKKIMFKQDFAVVKVLYDQRVKAKFKLGKEDTGEWYVIRSIFKQQYACEGKTKRKSFIWHF